MDGLVIELTDVLIDKWNDGDVKRLRMDTGQTDVLEMCKYITRIVVFAKIHRQSFINNILPYTYNNMYYMCVFSIQIYYMMEERFMHSVNLE